MRIRLQVLLLAVLVTAWIPVISSASTYARLRLLGVTWRKSVLNILVEGGTLEQKVAVSKAFKLWRAALNYYTRLYGYSYLRKLGFNVYIKGFNGSETGYDVVVTIIETIPDSAELGLTRLLTVNGKYVEKAEVEVYTMDLEGNRLSILDITNVAMHEIGHVLCLGHSDASSTLNGPELMYGKYKPVNMLVTPSTLDVYGVAMVFRWLVSGQPSPPTISTVNLKSSIPYRLSSYYYVNVISGIGHVEGTGWYLENSTCIVKAESIVEDGDVRFVFKGWTGDFQSNETILPVRVRSNSTLIAIWEKRYRVYIVNRTGNRDVASYWLPEGSLLRVSIDEPVVQKGNDTRLIFKGWVGSINTTSQNLLVRVAQPLKLEAVWEPQYLINITFTTGEGRLISPQPSHFNMSGRVYNNSLLWVSSGEYSIEWALWKGIRVRGLGKLNVARPGQYRARLALWMVNITISDPLGLPLPNTKVVLEGPVRIEEYSRLDKPVLPLLLPEGTYTIQLYIGPVMLGGSPIEVSNSINVRLHVKPSPYLVLLILAALLLVVTRRRVRE